MAGLLGTIRPAPCQNVEDCNEGDEQTRLLNPPPDAWLKRVTKENAERAKSPHSVKMMLNKEHYKKVVKWTRAKLARISRGSPCRMPSSSPSQGIARKKRSGAWTRVLWAARQSVYRPCWRG